MCFCFCGDCDVIVSIVLLLSTYGFNCYLAIIIVIYDPFSNKQSLAAGPTSSFVAVLTCAD